MKDYSNLSISKQLGNIVLAYFQPVTIIGGLLFRQRDVIRMIEFYSNSKYMDGKFDERGREKPFNNIINGMCDVENAAKDLDTKDARATSDDGQHYTEAFMLMKDAYQWMKRANFAKTLNDMRDTHTRYGSLLVKKHITTDSDGKKLLTIGIPEWKNTLTDQVNILEQPIIECHYMTPRKMYEKEGWHNVRESVEACMQSWGYATRVPVYEVRGWFPLSYFKECEGLKVNDADKTKFTYQLYYLAGSYVNGEMLQNFDMAATFGIGDLTPLYWENDTEQVYKYLARKKRAGRAFGVGVPEEGEEAQVWTNDITLKQFRAMEYTTKVVGQSASKKLKGRNMLDEVDDGQILEHEDGKPITSLTLLPSGGLNQYSLLLAQWFTQFERATSGYAAQRGESPSSRTAAKLQQAVIAQSSSVMQIITEEFGIFLTEIFDDWVMPYLGEQLSAEHILAHEFSLDELKQIDRNFSIHTANDMAKTAILNGQIVGEEDYAAYMQSADDMIKQTKATRFLKIPKDYYKKASAHITWNFTGEQRDRAGAIGALQGIYELYSQNPAAVNDPILTTLLFQIVELSGSGLSPVTLIAAIQEKARLQAEAEKKGANQPERKPPSESINYKDLPPDGQRQMAAQAGIDVQPTAAAVPEGAGPVAPAA